MHSGLTGTGLMGKGSGVPREGNEMKIKGIRILTVRDK
jgi:hypothetical protein